MNIIESNTPKYISFNEHLNFEKYLSRDNKKYFVLFHYQNLVACGGYELNNSQTKAGLSWGLVHRQHHTRIKYMILPYFHCTLIRFNTGFN